MYCMHEGPSKTNVENILSFQHYYCISSGRSLPLVFNDAVCNMKVHFVLCILITPVRMCQPARALRFPKPVVISKITSQSSQPAPMAFPHPPPEYMRIQVWLALLTHDVRVLAMCITPTPTITV
jgi:hypothetical protein